MKKFIGLVVLLLIFLVGCKQNNESVDINENRAAQENLAMGESKNVLENKLTDNQTSNSGRNKNEIVVNEQTSGDKGVFYLGMQYEKVMALDLYNTDLEITSMYDIKDDKNDWDYGHKVVWTRKLSCAFDNTNTMYKITVNADIPTKLGLKIGDSPDALEKLYGKCNKQYDLGWGQVLEYNIGDHFFDVSINDGAVVVWSVSKYKYDYKGKDR